MEEIRGTDDNAGTTSDIDGLEANSDIEPVKIKDRPGRVGVTSFLQGLTDANGKLLFPEFDEDAYWWGKSDKYVNYNSRVKSWASYDPATEDPNNPSFTKEEVEALFPDTLQPKALTTKAEQERAIQIMEAKWKA